MVLLATRASSRRQTRSSQVTNATVMLAPVSAEYHGIFGQTKERHMRPE
jgi:hypothetical protein